MLATSGCGMYDFATLANLHSGTVPKVATQVLVAGPTSYMLGLCGATPLTITIAASDATPVAGEAAVPVTVYGNFFTGTTSDFAFFSDSNCQDSISIGSLSVPAGKSEIQIYAQAIHANPSSPSTSVSFHASATGLTSGGQNYTILRIPWTLRWGSYPTTILTGSCSAAFTFSLVDFEGNSVSASGNLNVIVGGADGFIYSDGPGSGSGGCTQNLTSNGNNSSVLTVNNASFGSVYLMPIQTGTLRLSLAFASPQSPLQSGNETGVITVQMPSVLDHMTISTPINNTIYAGSCDPTPFTLTLYDQMGHPYVVPEPSGVTVTVSFSGVNGKLFPSCGTQQDTENSVTVANGQSSVQFYIMANNTGGLQLTADAYGYGIPPFTSQTYNSQQAPFGTPAISVSGPPSVASNVTQAYSVALTDAYNNPYQFQHQVEISISLSANTGNGVFQGSICATTPCMPSQYQANINIYVAAYHSSSTFYWVGAKNVTQTGQVALYSPTNSEFQQTTFDVSFQ